MLICRERGWRSFLDPISTSNPCVGYRAAMSPHFSGARCVRVRPPAACPKEEQIADLEPPEKSLPACSIHRKNQGRAATRNLRRASSFLYWRRHRSTPFCSGSSLNHGYGFLNSDLRNPIPVDAHAEIKRIRSSGTLSISTR